MFEKKEMRENIQHSQGRRTFLSLLGIMGVSSLLTVPAYRLIVSSIRGGVGRVDEWNGGNTDRSRLLPLLDTIKHDQISTATFGLG